MSSLAQRTSQAITQAADIVDRVCGACGNSCCHQGTMMGSHDALRLVKGMALEPGREQIVREGLRERACELRADLDTLRGVRNLIAASPTSEQGDLGQLNSVLEDWEGFCDFIEGPWEADVETLHKMLHFAAIRALALRAVSAFPGGHAALSTLAKEGSSFKFRGRRIAPPRCLFHSLETGCLAGRWKPGKCANFFCAGEPNVLLELRNAMSFDDFVLGNADLVTPQQAVKAVALEFGLGREFVEPKVFIGVDDRTAEELQGVLASQYQRLIRPSVPSRRFLQSSAECEGMLEGLAEDEACLVRCDAIDGAALYELAIALDRHRAAGESVAFVLLARDIATPSALPHPLWADEQMSQPLGVLDLYVVGPQADDTM